MTWTNRETRAVYRDSLDWPENEEAVREWLAVYGRRAAPHLARQLRKDFLDLFGRGDGELHGQLTRLALRRVDWLQVARRLIRRVRPRPLGRLAMPSVN